jgi:PAS domain S-box-containing protein
MKKQHLSEKKDTLTRFTLDNLDEAVFYTSCEGKILQVNAKACALTGYDKNELSRLCFTDINTAPQIQDFRAYWEKLLREQRVSYEARYRNKNGAFMEVENTDHIIFLEGKPYLCTIITDLRRKKLDEALLRTISEHTAAFTGEYYFLALAKAVTASLNIRFAMVNKIANKEMNRLRMLAYVDRNKELEAYEYDTKGTPCEVVMRGQEFFCTTDVDVKYPREKGIQSWLSVPVYRPSNGALIGNIGAFDVVPMSNEQNQMAVLRIFAARAGAEMERMEIEKDLERTNRELALRVAEVEQLKNQLQQENRYLQEEIRLNHNFEEIISVSASFRGVLQQIEQVAATGATVLILGESGTGKELIARAIHNISPRKGKPLVKVNCAALPENLIESELFGHERGAFTGALEKRTGRFELADGGTLFLDEIGELPLSLQAKLLRVLQEGELERLGGSKTLKVNVRVLAATNRDLEGAVAKGEFRADLFYRLNVFPVVCPPLRERKEDIPYLVRHFCAKYEARIGKKVTSLGRGVLEALQAYHWPGNIRELENILERALILMRGEVLEKGPWLPQSAPTSSQKGSGAGSAATAAPTTLEAVERTHILEVLRLTKGKVSGEKGAARLLGLNPTTLEARMKKLGINRAEIERSGASV